MQITIKTEALLNFLRKCLLNKLTKDLVLFATGKEIHARLTDPDKSFYFEVVETEDVKVKEEGHITIANLDKVISCLGRIKGDLVAIKSNENEFLITDGSKPIKFMQIPEPLIESYNARKLLDREALSYVDGMCEFSAGFEVEHDYLMELLGDAKAFGVESYNFFAKDEDCWCKIEDKQLNENLKSKLKIVKWFDDSKIVNITVGLGFREIITILGKEKNKEKKEDKNVIQIYVTPQAILITSAARKYFYCLHCF